MHLIWFHPQILDETRAQVGSRLVDCAHEFDHAFWMGDLNYRIDLNSLRPVTEEEHWGQVMRLIENEDWPALMAADQLCFCRTKGEAFAGFVEGSYAFSPTFKVERKPGTTLSKQRIPSYCDRVLWKSMPPLAGCVKQRFLRSAPTVSTSDHKPVFTAFDITPSPMVRPLKPGVQPPLVRMGGVSVHGVQETDKTYLVFLTNPPGLLGEDPPRTSISYSRRTQPYRFDVHWSDRNLPLLRPRVNDAADLARVTVIVAVYDSDMLSQDDLLGIVLVPLAQPGASVRVKNTNSYTISVEKPLVKGNISVGIGMLKAQFTVSYGVQLESALADALSSDAGKDVNTSHRNVFCCSPNAPMCSVQ